MSGRPDVGWKVFNFRQLSSSITIMENMLAQRNGARPAFRPIGEAPRGPTGAQGRQIGIKPSADVLVVVAASCAQPAGSIPLRFIPAARRRRDLSDWPLAPGGPPNEAGRIWSRKSRPGPKPGSAARRRIALALVQPARCGPARSWFESWLDVIEKLAAIAAHSAPASAPISAPASSFSNPLRASALGAAERTQRQSSGAWAGLGGINHWRAGRPEPAPGAS